MLSYTITTATPDDAFALLQLAALDSAEPLALPALIAQRDDRPVAAIELATGRVVADPFTPSLDARALLELRRGQLERASAGAGRRIRRRLLRATTARAV
jgi:hypothetical protein